MATKSRALTRVLVYPNITFQKDLGKDSYIDLIRKQIAGLNAIRDDLWFYLIEPVPSTGPGLIRASRQSLPENVTVLGAEIPSHPPMMRVTFRPDQLGFLISGKFDFDVVYSHLPEHTFQLVSLMLNNTHYDVPFLGYAHWFDFPHAITWPKGALPLNLIGLCEMRTCFLNTECQRGMVLNEAQDVLCGSRVRRLESVLKVYYLGVDDGQIHPPAKKTERVIVFNHRPWKYKDFDGFMAVCDALRKRRKDFTVWIPLLDKPNRPWVVTDRFDDKEDYYKALRNCRVGFAPMQKYGGWSIAALDGLMNGVPYIMFDGDYYRELCPVMPTFTGIPDAVDLFDKFLSDNDYRNRVGQRATTHVRRHLRNALMIERLSSEIDRVRDSGRMVTERSTAIQKILRILRNSGGSLPKAALMKKLKWGRDIKWSPYRRKLIHEGFIAEKRTAEPIYTLTDKGLGRC